MRSERIGDGVYRVRGDAYDSGATVFARDGEALLVDALGSRADAEALRLFVEKDLRSRVRFIVATHYFSDHLAGLAHFPGAEIVAHRAHRHTFDEERHRSDEERGFYVRPTLEAGDGLLLRWGGLSFDLFHVPGHTMSTLAVDVPELDMLHVGDTVVGRIVYLAYGSPELLEGALALLARRGRGRVLASHGGVGGPGLIEAARYYLGQLEQKVREGIEDVALADCLPPGLAPEPVEEVFHQRNRASIQERHLWSSS